MLFRPLPSYIPYLHTYPMLANVHVHHSVLLPGLVGMLFPAHVGPALDQQREP
jgi:hypothetical protein